MNEPTSNREQPNYFAIIPAYVRYDKELSANARLLYGELTALASKEGYCWASNNYFADLYDVDVRTVSRWLEQLKEKDYIEIDTQKRGMEWDRRIYIKICLRRDNNVHSNGQKCPLRRDKNVHRIRHSKIIQEQQQEAPPPPDPVVVVFPIFDDLKIPKAMKERLSSQMDQEKACKLVQRVKAWTGRESDAKACNTILAQWEAWEDPSPKENREQLNREWAKTHLSKYDNKRVGDFNCEVLNKCVEFIHVSGSGSPKIYSYEDSAFRELISRFMRENL